MRDSLDLPANLLAGFLLVMARMGGIMTFLPIPGLKSGPDAARIVFSVTSAFLMFPQWAKARGPIVDSSHFFAGIVSEAMLGIAIGLAMSYLFEILTMAAQSLSLQAGYGYATTIDPTTDADAGFLVVVAQLLAGLLFFALGLDRRVLAIVGRSFATAPPGSLAFSPSAAEGLAESAAIIFSTGLRLALPVIALLAMADISLALLGRLNSHLQVTAMSFPIKMMAALALLAGIATLIPTVLQQAAEPLLRLTEQIALGPGR
jgi:flagellar biosynthetic protein FliR